MPVRIAYLDLDGTLTRDGSMLHGARGPTLAGARALLALHEARVEIVPTTGRTLVQAREVARTIGARSCIAELGCVILRDGEMETTYDAATWPGPRSPTGRTLAAACARVGATPYEPWFSMRDHTLLLRGAPGLAQELAAVVSRAVPAATAIDNGEVEHGLHAYHVLPRGVSKETAIARDLVARGLSREDAVAFGDSEEDRRMARAVGTMYHLGGPDGERIAGVADRFGEGFEVAVRQALSL